MNNKANELNKWLNACPLPVIARVITEVNDLRHILTSSHIYEDNMLLVVDLKKISKILD